MNDSDEELRQAVALFRYGLIADVLRLAPGSPDIRRTLHHKAQRTYTIPAPFAPASPWRPCATG